VETALLRDVKRRIEELAATSASGEPADSRIRLLSELINASMDTDPRRSQEELQLRILRQLLPDEARILAALSDGTRYALVHVYTRGGGVRPLLENACTVGRVAAVHVNGAVPLYVSHLRQLGLADEGTAEDLLSDQYALLTNEDVVQRAITNAGGSSRTVRRTLRISRLGVELWTACTGQRELWASPAGRSSERYVSAYAGASPIHPQTV
jgi:hypothetical protein